MTALDSCRSFGVNSSSPAEHSLQLNRTERKSSRADSAADNCNARHIFDPGDSPQSRLCDHFTSLFDRQILQVSKLPSMETREPALGAVATCACRNNFDFQGHRSCAMRYGVGYLEGY